MLTQALAVAATILGLLSTWLIGHKRCIGWPIGIVCCLIWLAVNLDVHVWAGALSALLGAAVAARNWSLWRHTARHA